MDSHFVVHHKGLDLGLLVEERGVGGEDLAFLGVVLVLADFLEACLHGFGGDFLLPALAYLGG